MICVESKELVCGCSVVDNVGQDQVDVDDDSDEGGKGRTVTERQSERLERTSRAGPIAHQRDAKGTDKSRGRRTWVSNGARLLKLAAAGGSGEVTMTRSRYGCRASRVEIGHERGIDCADEDAATWTETGDGRGATSATLDRKRGEDRCLNAAEKGRDEQRCVLRQDAELGQKDEVTLGRSWVKSR